MVLKERGHRFPGVLLEEEKALFLEFPGQHPLTCHLPEMDHMAISEPVPWPEESSVPIGLILVL